jgi:SAM-dependent methyltransferase
MDAARTDNTWTSGDAYESYVGRWSRAVAREFLAWLAVADGRRWLDVGCGTGALSEEILETASPSEVVGIDLSPAYVAYAREHVVDHRARFEVGDARALPFPSGRFDAVVSGLALNFVPEPARAAAEFARVAARGGAVGVYVWDYTDGMALMRHFWDAAVALDPAARALDEGPRFAGICRPEALAGIFTRVGLQQVDARAIDVPTTFVDFDDVWQPFLGEQGPAPAYVASLDEERRVALRERLRADLPVENDGAIHLMARAYAVRGRRAAA